MPNRPIAQLVRVSLQSADRLISVERVRFVSLAIVALAIAVLAVFFVTEHEGRSAFGTGLGADFAAFYTAGTIAADGQADKLYDLEMQDRTYRRLFTNAPPDTMTVFPCAPFTLLLFAPLSQLPYAWSFGCWLLLTLAAYCAGLAILWRVLGGIASIHASTVLLAALAFLPFLLESWVGGQTSAIGFLCVAGGVACLLRGWDLRSGLLLATCAYKPTLLSLILPMLVVRMHWKVLLGVLLGAVCWFGVSLWIVGAEGCMSYVEFLRHYGTIKRTHPEAFLTWKYIDIPSSVRVTVGQPPQWLWTAVVCVMLLGLGCLVHRWARLARGARGAECLAWALAIGWTPVLSPHFAIYDSTLLVAAGILAGKVWKESLDQQPPGFIATSALVFVTAAVTQPISRLMGVQPYTWAIVAWGVFLVVLAGRYVKSQSTTDKSQTNLNKNKK